MKLLKHIFLITSLAVVCSEVVFSQAVFQSRKKSGAWDKASSWNIISGFDADGVPDANDDVIILATHTISLKVDAFGLNLTFAGGTLEYTKDLLVSIGNDVNVSASSSITGYSTTHQFVASGDLNVQSGTTLAVGAIDFTVSGQSTIDGTLSLSGFGQNKSLGDILINAGGVLEYLGLDTYYITGDVTNNGTFSANSFGQVFNFTSSTGNISGSNLISLHTAVFNAPASYTNTGSIQIRNDMSGNGAFTNGTGGQLELQNGGPFTVSTFDASSVGNIVTYTGYGNPTTFSGDFYDLVVQKSSGTINFGSSLSVLNNLSLESGTLEVNAVTVTVHNDLLIQGGEFTPNNGAGVTNVLGDVVMTGGQYDHNFGTVNVSGDLGVFSGLFYLDGTSVLNTGSAQYSIPVTLQGGSLNVSNNLTLHTGTALSSSGTNVAVGNTFNFLDGTAQFTSGTFAPVNISVTAGKELIITDAVLNSTGVTTVNGTITFSGSSGSKSLGDLIVASGGIWNVTQTNNFSISGDIENNGTFNGGPAYGSSVYSLSKTTGTISGTSPMTIPDILINSPSSYTNTADLSVLFTLSGTGEFVNGTGGKLTFKGNNSTGSNFDITSFSASDTGNTVEYAGTYFSQQWRPTVSANNDYYNVIINTNTGGYQSINLIENVRVNGTLSITEGDIMLGDFDLEFGDAAAVTGADMDDFIRMNGAGMVRKYYTTTGGSIFIPIGDNSGNYSPITDFTLVGGTLGGNPYVEFSLTDAVHPNKDANNIPLGGDDDGTTSTDYISRYWTVSGNDILTPDYNVSFVYVDADVIGTESNMIGAFYRTPPGYAFKDWHEKGVVNSTTNTVTITGADNFGDLYAMDNTDLRLPIDLVSFTAEAIDATVKLEWKTASELDNEFFTIERSVDGREFEIVKMVKGAGSSSELLTYSTIDQYPISGRSFYRLKQTDFNGYFEYSEIQSVYVKVEAFPELSVEVYPNPVSRGEILNLKVMGLIESGTQTLVELYNLTGQKVLSKKMNGNSTRQNRIEIPGNIKKGLYILRVTSGFKKVDKRVIIN